MNHYLKDFPEYTPMVNKLRTVYNYFEKNKELPVILVNGKGEYVTDDIADFATAHEEKRPKPQPVKKRPLKREPDIEIAKVVNNLPVYPGGAEKFNNFLEEVGKEMAAYLEEDQTTSYVLIEFIIDNEGKPVWAQVTKGGNDALNEKLEARFENMPQWKPAIRLEKNVAVKLKQTVIVEKRSS